MMVKSPRGCSRRFAWISSVDGDQSVLAELDAKMTSFYSDPVERTSYQSMLEAPGNQGNESSIRMALPKYVAEVDPTDVLEVGCADGRQYVELRRAGFRGKYTGVEMASVIIDRNAAAHPDGQWRVGSAYALPFPDQTFDLVFSVFVLEHLVYPEAALSEMLRTLKPHGLLLLVFPDFVAKGQLSSQQLGFSVAHARASQKFRHGRWLDAAVSVFDSRFRLPQALRQLPRAVGRFPVNAEPICLTHRDIMRPDVDAVYIASKREVDAWASARGHTVRYPLGVAGYYDDIAFMSIERS